MKTARLPLAEIAIIGATRGMLGAGIGLLAAKKLKDAKRRTIGMGLFLVGALSTVPLVIDVFGRLERAKVPRKAKNLRT